MGIFEGKKGLIFGVADEKSLAWGVAQALHAEGAELGFNYNRQKEGVETLAASLGSRFIEQCNVADDEGIDTLFAKARNHFGRIDFLVHSVAFAPRGVLRIPFSDIPRSGFQVTLDISCYSLIALAKRAKEIMPNGGSIVTMSYYGAEKVVPLYNVMGVAKAALEASVRYLAYDLGQYRIRVNAISAGSVKTQATAGVGAKFDAYLDYIDAISPLGTVEQAAIGNAARFLLSDWATHITGEVLYVDGGFNIMMPHPTIPE